MKAPGKAPSLIYLVEDEPDIANLVVNELQRYGHRVQSFVSGTELNRALANKLPSLCIVDLGLPDMDGLSLVRELDQKQPMGVLILSGRDSLPDRVLGLELGADDYISKPFDPRELVARVNSILRRIGRSEAFAAPVDSEDGGPLVARFGNWQFDSATLELRRLDENSESTELSAGEARLLQQLLMRPKQILSRDTLLMQNDDAFDRSIDVRMSRIRKKIEQDPKSPKLIKTVYGMGYMLTVDVHWESPVS
ncbi:MAG: response regulator transcription factor [Oceanobacter sp.]